MSEKNEKAVKNESRPRCDKLDLLRRRSSERVGSVRAGGQ
jgi:hypothetical protein